MCCSGTKRWRVVTTDGVVINPSGTMEGGGKPLRGRMGGAPPSESLSEAEMSKLSKLVASLSARIEQIRSERATTQVTYTILTVYVNIYIYIYIYTYTRRRCLN